MRHFVYSCMLIALSGQVAFAESVTSNGIEVFANSLKYIHGLHQKDSGLTIAALYDPAKAESLRDAEYFVAQLAKTKNGADLKAIPMPFTELRNHTDISIAYVASGQATNYSAIAAVAAEHHVFTIGLERECVIAGSCILGIETLNGINIYLNEKALQTSDFSVDAAFKFMVKTI